ncbi:chemotaxis protein CheB [Undibacterium sp. 5I1]|uniref:chemotaxis protein CheB n=1 Tax=unclassified Undibacterium TaxID=2630295 RepID=UPI002AB3D2F9|nr:MULTISPECIES: chemotaxis protein CheB [unclassified Undibacterium]MDY7540695.1 chemotaxis protein CheB [Undibacterium sp. 5I1]MEB0233079.1 chemotaxis protein CheB [Undibacterium sp. 10I3]MEB0259814.1 chemotaxis protein CheB [Undibacterium sp. 5I1]
MPAKKIIKDTLTETSEVMALSEMPSSLTSTAPDIAFPIVGIGASAGGLESFEQFFSGFPADAEPSMAFVLVQHLAPDHKSLLTDLIRRCTHFEVFEAEDGMEVRQNCVYVIPPNFDMAFLNGVLHLLEPSAPRGQRLPIDFFFRSLANDQRKNAIGIVLSGTGSDGTLGARAIKGEGGMLMSQTPESSEFDGMPRSVIATGLTDYILPSAEMAAQLITYVKHAYGKLHRHPAVDSPHTESALKKIFILLRSQTNHDFSNYKPSTINRRIKRRMAVHQINDIDSYVKYLQKTPPEAVALFRDLLIGVTNFFRDPDVFEVLEHEIIPRLFADKPPGAVIRVWSTGCSTGEEAYSIAILLQERIEKLKQNYSVQVFATDIDSRAIAIARAGLYPISIAADISPERLAHYFSLEPDGNYFRIHKSIRDMLVFSEQDLIKDPPFSRLDLISCRNLLIYLGMPLQKKLIPLFHYALKKNGILLLGTSEGIGDFIELFKILDRKAKLFQRKDDRLEGHNWNLLRTISPTAYANQTQIAGIKKMEFPAKLQLRELTEQALLQQLAPVCALVNWHGDILYLHGRTGKYLEPTPGEVGTNNILKMARDGLRSDLTLSLQKATVTKETARCSGLLVKTNGHYTLVNLIVCPVSTGSATTAEAYLYLVILEDVTADSSERSLPVDDSPIDEKINLDVDTESRITLLKQELRAKDEYLQSTREELESSNEELKSSNEEMQSVNEELQSTNEELETSKEELQSVNEELATVNHELQTKILSLSRANNDMNNLMAGTGIGTVFVDFKLHILRFTPAASTIINLIPSDIGRPVAHIVSNLVGYDGLVSDTQTVLDTLAVKEITVQTTMGRWYNMRIQPYRTLDNVIEGAVVSFVDITEIVQTRDALHKATELLRLAVVVRDAYDAITMQDLNGRILAWNQGAVRMYGWTEAEALLMNTAERIPENLRAEALTKVQELSQAEILEPYLTQRRTKLDEIVEVSITSTALIKENGEIYAIATTERIVGKMLP